MSSMRITTGFALAASLLASLSGVEAHGNVQELTIDGTLWSGYLPYSDPYASPVPDRIMRVIPGNGPVQDVTISDVRCNTGGETPAKLIAPAAAGSQIAFNWTTWPDSHKGPMITYMAAVPSGTNITEYDPDTDAVWFKIDEAGYEDGKWASTDILAAQDSIWTVTIPSSLVAGQYLVRHETIALHSAGTYPGAQLYMSCSQLQVTGDGTDSPSAADLVAFPGAYAGTDPGITFDLYSTFTSYTIPGPAVWPASGSSSSGAASSAVAATSAAAETSAVASSAAASSAAAATSAAAVSSAPAVTSAASSVPTTAAAVASSVVTSAPAAASSAAADDGEGDDDECDVYVTTSAAGASATASAPATATSAAAGDDGDDTCDADPEDESSTAEAASTAASATTAAAATTSAAAAATSAASSSGTVENYGQCGGANWTGATVCGSGWTCTEMNDYYSQCVESSSRARALGREHIARHAARNAQRVGVDMRRSRR